MLFLTSSRTGGRLQSPAPGDRPGLVNRIQWDAQAVGQRGWCRSTLAVARTGLDWRPASGTTWPEHGTQPRPPPASIRQPSTSLPSRPADGFHLGTPAEVAQDTHQSLVEHPAIRGISAQDQNLHAGKQPGSHRLRVILVRVPAAVGDRDESYAGLDQPARADSPSERIGRSGRACEDPRGEVERSLGRGRDQVVRLLDSRRPDLGRPALIVRVCQVSTTSSTFIRR